MTQPKIDSDSTLGPSPLTKASTTQSDQDQWDQSDAVAEEAAIAPDASDAPDEAVWVDEEWLVASKETSAPLPSLSPQAIAACNQWTLEGLL